MDEAQDRQGCFAVKLSVKQLSECVRKVDGTKKTYTFQGLRVETVWLQGIVRSKRADLFVLSQEDNSVEIKVPCQIEYQRQFEAIEEGQYVLVIGKLMASKLAKKGSHVKAHKIKVLKDGASRLQLWDKELCYLHSVVYPCIVQRSHSQSHNSL